MAVLISTYEHLDFEKQIGLAVNKKYVTDDVVCDDGDEVARCFRRSQAAEVDGRQERSLDHYRTIIHTSNRLTHKTISKNVLIKTKNCDRMPGW